MALKKCDCLNCRFNNPKPTNSAVIIKDGKLLLAKRKRDPFKGVWDFFGGYVNAGETIEQSLIREVKEELNVDSEITYIGSFPGNASYQGNSYPVLNFAYLTELKGEPKLDKKENSELKWISIAEIKKVAFDSNMDILKFVKDKFTVNWEDVKKLVSQLDSTAQVKEQSFYKALLTGYVAKVEERGRLLGMGWAFPRQTILRNQAIVEDMIVDESQRGKGLGEKILKDLIAQGKKDGVEVFELTTNPKRIAANGLYQKVGFKLHPTNHYLLDLR
jgi:ADP-ribose pyrophosphatase YjhB (NUDIX family)